MTTNPSTIANVPPPTQPTVVVAADLRIRLQAHARPADHIATNDEGNEDDDDFDIDMMELEDAAIAEHLNLLDGRPNQLPVEDVAAVVADPAQNQQAPPENHAANEMERFLLANAAHIGNPREALLNNRVQINNRVRNRVDRILNREEMHLRLGLPPP